MFLFGEKRTNLTWKEKSMEKEIAQSTNDIGLENEIPKYQKKAKSNISKAKSKSNHKHQNNAVVNKVERYTILGCDY